MAKKLPVHISIANKKKYLIIHIIFYGVRIRFVWKYRTGYCTQAVQNESTESYAKYAVVGHCLNGQQEKNQNSG